MGRREVDGWGTGIPSVKVKIPKMSISCFSKILIGILLVEVKILKCQFHVVLDIGSIVKMFKN